MSYTSPAIYMQRRVTGTMTLTGELPDGRFDAKYYGTLTLSGESGDVDVTISAGALPVGVEAAFNGANVAVGGVPVDTPLEISGDFADGDVGRNYGSRLTISGAVGAVTVTVIGTLPPGLTIEGDDAILQGEPT